MNQREVFQDAIFESMARTLWLLSYADWVEQRREDEAGEDDQEYQGDVGEPGPGGDWDEVAPPTPIAALEAAHNLAELIAAANGIVANKRSDYPMFEMFVSAMEGRLGHPLYDEPWHTEITKTPNDKELRSVYADWLEEQGRTEDATFVRTHSGQTVANFMGHLDEAQEFGSALAFMGLGTGVGWGDDHITKRGMRQWKPFMPAFECHYDGEDLTWPGQIVDEQVREEYDRLVDEYLEEQNQGRMRGDADWLAKEDIDDNVLDQLRDEAEVDTTVGGNYSNRIDSGSWGIAAEDPSDTDLLRIAGLTKNPPRKKKPPKEPESAYDQLATVLFRDTVTARMLRTLMDKGEMTQADFMRDYQRRCEREKLPRYRTDRAPDASLGEASYWTPGQKPGASSFLNNFGRFVTYSDDQWPITGMRTEWGWVGGGDGPSIERPVKVIRQSSIPAKGTRTRSQYRLERGVTKAIDARNMLHWIGPSTDELLDKMSLGKLEWAYANLERQLTSPRDTDDPADVGRWVERLRAAQNRYKSNPVHGGRQRHYQPVR